jgi:hypothetical protein
MTISFSQVQNAMQCDRMNWTLLILLLFFGIQLALFRDYTFAASAYLLEPCDIMYRSKDDYGLGRQILPENIAVPLVKVSEKIHSKPFME